MTTRPDTQRGSIRGTFVSRDGGLALVALGVALGGIALIQAFGLGLSDCMGFYHLALARLYGNEGIIRSFPQMPFSEMGAHFVDQHFLYNLLLVPFVWLFDSADLAAQAATLFWLTVLGMLLIGALGHFQVEGRGLFVLLLFFGIHLFAARTFMPRPMTASVVFLLAFHVALFKRSPLALFIIAFAYGWLYHASVQVLASAGVFVVLLYLYERKIQDRLFTAPLVGFVLSLIVNPFTPHSLTYFIRHTFFLSHADLGVAIPAEWVGVRFPIALKECAIVLALLLVLALPYLWKRKRPGLEATYALLMTALYFFATLKAIRFFEYLGLFPVLAAAFLLRDLPGGDKVRRLALVALALAALGGVIVSAPKLWEYYQTRAFPEMRMAGAAAYLKQHAAPGDTIFNTYSGDFPELFWHAPDFGYTEGFNHALMAVYDRDLYKDFKTVLEQPQGEGARIVRERFGARYVVVSKWSAPLAPGLMTAIYAGRGFRVVYQDEDAMVVEALPADENERAAP